MQDKFFALIIPGGYGILGEQPEKVLAHTLANTPGCAGACAFAPDGAFENIQKEAADCSAILLIKASACSIAPELLADMFGKWLTGGDAAFYPSDGGGGPYAVFAASRRADTALIEDFIAGRAAGMATRSCDYNPARTPREARLASEKRGREIIEVLEDAGVSFVSTDGVVISPLAKVGRGCLIWPGTVILGESSVGEGSRIGPNTLISSSSVGRDCVINSTQVYSSKIEDHVEIGPFCHIRPNSHIESGVHLGDFIEVKNSHIGRNTGASHLTYIGDADVGENVNFGCGVVTANFDGVNKGRCVIGDRAFIGCNTNLISPVSVGEDAYIAAGSTIIANVPPGVLAICRAKERRDIEGEGARRNKLRMERKK